MARPSLTGVLHYVRALVSVPHGDALADSALLQRFAGERDEAALVTLLQRHGPLVLAVCRQVLADPHAAEDAFQATFLVLAQKAASIRQHESLGAWLHRVAYHAALKVRTAAARRRYHEREAVAMQHPPAKRDPETEWQPVLHAEVDRLPTKYRVPLVLCYLQGQTQEQVAETLNWPITTVRGRLSQARSLLHRRLVRRGIALSAASLLSIGPEASASVPPALLDATARAAAAFVGEGAVPSSLALLAGGLLHDMVRTRLKSLAVVFLVISLLGAGAGTLVHQLTRMQTAPVGRLEQAEWSPVLPEPSPAPSDRAGDLLPPGALARLGGARFLLGEPVDAVTLASDGKTLAAAGARSVHVWEAATGRTILRIHKSTGAGAVFSPNGQALAVADGKLVRVWDWANRKERLCLAGHQNLVAALAFGPDGKSLVSVSRDRTARLWDLTSGKEIRQFVGHRTGLEDVAFSHNGQILATRSDQRDIRLWDVASGQEVRSIPGRKDDGLGAQCASTLVFSPDGLILASVGGTIRFYEVATGTEVAQLDRQQASGGGFQCVAFAPDGKTFATGSFRTVSLWETATTRRLHQFNDHLHWVTSVAFSADGKTIVSGCHGGLIRLWEAETGTAVPAPISHRTEVETVAYAPDGRTIASASADGSVRLWRPATGEHLRQFSVEPGSVDKKCWARDLAFSPDGRLLAYGTSNGPFRVWDVATGQEDAAFKAAQLGTSCQAPALAFAPDGKSLALGTTAGAIRVWDVASGQPVRWLQGHKQWVTAVAFFPDGQKLISASEDRTIRLWDVATGQELRQVKPHKERVDALAIAPDGKTLAFGGSWAEQELCLWDLGTDQELYRLKTDEDAARQQCTRAGYDRSVTLAFAPDGKTLAAASRNNTVHLWEVATGKQVRRCEGHEGMIRTIAFAPDGRSLASGSDDTTLLIWDLTGGCRDGRLAVRKLTSEELVACWQELATEDVPRAYRSLWALVAAPTQSVPMLRARVHPASAGDPLQIARCIENLASDRFEVRLRATQELEHLGDAAAVALHQVLNGEPAPEVRQRVVQLLGKLDGPDIAPDRLAALRAVQVLEQIGTAEARQVLARLAGGAEGARLTCDARTSLGRLSKRPLIP